MNDNFSFETKAVLFMDENKHYLGFYARPKGSRKDALENAY